MKWINSRRFVVCLICLAVIIYAVIFKIENDIPVIEYFVPVLVAFMGATTVEKGFEKFNKREE